MKKNAQILILVLSIALAGVVAAYYRAELNNRIFRGDLALMGKAFGSAEAHYRFSLKLNPFSTYVKGGLASALIGQGKHDEAESILKKLLSKHPNDEFLLYGYAQLNLAKNNHSEAEKAAQQIISINPKTTKAYSILAKLYRDEKQYEKAEDFAIKAIENAKYLPADPTYLRAAPMKDLVEIYNETGRYGESISIIGEILKFHNDVSCLFELGKLNEYLKSGVAAKDSWQLFLKHADQKFTAERAFAEKRLYEIEKNNFLNPPTSLSAKTSWGEIPRN